MDKIIELFEKALSEYQATIGKKDNLVGSGEILLQEFKKNRDAVVTLGQLLGDFYAQDRGSGRRAQTLTHAEIFERQTFPDRKPQ